MSDDPEVPEKEKQTLTPQAEAMLQEHIGNVASLIMSTPTEHLTYLIDRFDEAMRRLPFEDPKQFKSRGKHLQTSKHICEALLDFQARIKKAFNAAPSSALIVPTEN